MTKREAFPEKGQPKEEILAALTQTQTHDLPSDGQAFAFVYDAGEDIRQVAQQALAACAGINGLDPTAYPSFRIMENDVVAASLAHLRAPEGAVGTATAGGTESVLLAVKTARDYARKHRPHITAPEMLLPETAHASFQKAAHYFGVKPVLVNVDPTTMRADVDDAREKITDQTVLVVGSAPSYAHGVIDPIAELAELAQTHQCLMHVDACIGGWVLPFQRELGLEQTPFDFTIPGVTSISMDLHKYAFAPKGVSVLLQRRRDLRDAQYYACATWSGYTIVNPTTLGSKSAAPLGAAWALLRYVGREGYRNLVKSMWDATQKLVTAIEQQPQLRLLGQPDMGLIAFTTPEGDIFELADRLTLKGWHVQPTYAFGASPAHIHLSIDPGNAGKVNGFLSDLQSALVDLEPPQEPPAQVLQMLEALLGADSTEAGGGISIADIMTQLGIENGQLPQRAAVIHRLLNAASPALRERLLVLFVGELFSSSL